MDYLFRRSTVKKSRDNRVKRYPRLSHSNNAVNVCHQRDRFGRNRECHSINLSDALNC